MTVDLLNLGSCNDHGIRENSGIQFKLTSIGLQFISRPAVLIIDDPTSGLNTADNVIRLMKRLSSESSVITTIHQPTLVVLDTCDFVCRLNARGENNFRGTLDQIVPFVSMEFPA